MSYKRQEGRSWSCILCGALVDNTTLHDKWHQDLQILAALANTPDLNKEE